jgi:hypothetical protein
VAEVRFSAAVGDVTEVDLQLDDEPRVVVVEPPDLAAALDQDPRARATFDQLPYGLKNKHVRDIEGAKSPETRQRRIAKLVTTISGGRDAWLSEHRPAGTQLRADLVGPGGVQNAGRP